jgi:hypothetical protein
LSDVICQQRRHGYDAAMVAFRFFLQIFWFAAFTAAGAAQTQTPDQQMQDQQIQEPLEKIDPVPEVPPPEPNIPPMPVPRTERPDISMEAYGTANPECMQWMDSCQTCARDAQNKISCSTPGIACIQGDITCETKRK